MTPCKRNLANLGRKVRRGCLTQKELDGFIDFCHRQVSFSPKSYKNKITAVKCHALLRCLINFVNIVNNITGTEDLNSHLICFWCNFLYHMLNSCHMVTWLGTQHKKKDFLKSLKNMPKVLIQIVLSECHHWKYRRYFSFFFFLLLLFWWLSFTLAQEFTRVSEDHSVVLTVITISSVICG